MSLKFVTKGIVVTIDSSGGLAINVAVSITSLSSMSIFIRGDTRSLMYRHSVRCHDGGESLRPIRWFSSAIVFNFCSSV